MVRGRVEMKRIENKNNRQVTFTKRRNGLLKKARELSILCDAQIAVIIFSSRGKLFEFGSNPGLMQTIERYEKTNYSASEVSITSREIQTSQMEYMRLKSHLEALQRSERNLLGDDLDSLSATELQQLEIQMNATLKQIDIAWRQHVNVRFGDLQQKENMLSEENKMLWRRLEETNLIHQLRDLNTNHEVGFGQRPAPPPAGFGYYQALISEPIMPGGYNADVLATTQNPEIFLAPGWLPGL